MALVHEWNNKTYSAKLHALLYLCNNYWRFCLETETTKAEVVLGQKDGVPFFEVNVKPSVEFGPPDYASFPLDVIEDLDMTAIDDLSYTINQIWVNRHEKHVTTLDDLLEMLTWAFNPQDLQDYKVCYIEPKLPRTKRGKVKR